MKNMMLVRFRVDMPNGCVGEYLGWVSLNTPMASFASEGVSAEILEVFV